MLSDPRTSSDVVSPPSPTSPPAGLADLVAGAGCGEAQAWAQLVAHYEPQIRAVARRFRLSSHDAADISQTVWLQLYRHIGSLREPAALPGWIGTATRRACLDLVTQRRRTVAVDPITLNESVHDGSAVGVAGGGGDLDASALLREGRHAVREGLAELSGEQRDLLLHLVADPPLSYRQISARLGLPVGSIGPTRARLLRKLGSTASVRRYLGDDQPEGTDLGSAA